MAHAKSELFELYNNISDELQDDDVNGEIVKMTEGKRTDIGDRRSPSQSQPFCPIDSATQQRPSSTRSKPRTSSAATRTITRS